MPEVTKVTIEESDCISCEACVSECDEVFEMAGSTAVVKPAAQNAEFLKPRTEKIIAAKDVCPSDAIKLEMQ